MNCVISVNLLTTGLASVLTGARASGVDRWNTIQTDVKLEKVLAKARGRESRALRLPLSDELRKMRVTLMYCFLDVEKVEAEVELRTPHPFHQVDGARVALGHHLAVRSPHKRK